VSFCSNQTAANLFNLIICVQCRKNSVLLLERAAELGRATQIFSAQAAAKNLIWMRSVVRRDVGKDVSLLVGDVARYESSGLKRRTTWGKKGNKQDKRHVENTMGYQLPE
jgi:hypothetical protein